MSTTTDRLRVFMGAATTVPAFAQTLDEDPQRIKDVLRGKQRLPEDLLVKLLERTDIDVRWLLLGPDAPQAAAPIITQAEKRLLGLFRAMHETNQKKALSAMAALFEQSMMAGLSPMVRLRTDSHLIEHQTYSAQSPRPQYNVIANGNVTVAGSHNQVTVPISAPKKQSKAKAKS